MSVKPGKLLLAAFTGLFVLIGIGLLVNGVLSVWRSTRAARWPIATGTLSKVEQVNRPDSEGPCYVVEVIYVYNVAGKAYTSSRLAFDYSGSGDCETARKICSKLKSANSVDVRYDPADPAIAVLTYGLHKSIRFKLAFATTWLGFVSGIWLLSWLVSRSDRVLIQNLSKH